MSTDARGVSDVLHDIFGNLQDIVRSEVRLIKTEVEESLAKCSRPAVIVAIRAMLGSLAVLFVLLAVVFALSRIMPNGAAALFVAPSLVILLAPPLPPGVSLH